MTTVLYLLGAGRSGTTLMATVLHAHPQIHTLGELHQFPEYTGENAPCSCGEPLDRCPFWGSIVKGWREEIKDVEAYRELSQELESHRNIPRFLMRTKPQKDYLTGQELLFGASASTSGKPVLLDSSKYIARFLLLNRSKKFRVKGVYVVRDVRGVIESFGKQVQTPKSPFSSLIYYCLINFFGELVYRLHGNVVKLKYEDFLKDPQAGVDLIAAHISTGDASKFALPDVFPMPHIVGGNRMKSQREISIRPKDGWRSRTPGWKRLLYYVAALPFMLINRYGI